MMSDIFISYSRKDIAFVRELYAGLVNENFKVWVDWEGIPPSAEWLEEIFHAIEQSDVFIFVLSAASCRSEICLKELQYAVRNNKRLIPVVVEEFAAADVPATVARLNWLFFFKDNDFSTAFQGLLDTINTDLVWVRTHTQLLNKSLEWDAKRQEKSLLLRGKELRTAESNISINQDKEPLLTSLQLQYVKASRQSSHKRKLFFSGVLLLGLLILGVVSWIANQQRLAKEAEKTAKELERTEGVKKQARLIAADAFQETGDKGIQTAIDAVKLLRTVSNDLDPNVHNTLIEKARMYRFEPRAVGTRARVSSFTLGVRQLVFTADAKLLGTSYRHEALRAWSLCLDKADDALCGKKIKKEELLKVPQKKVSVTTNRLGKKAVLVNGKDLQVYSITDKAKQICRQPFKEENPQVLSLSPDGKWAAVRYGSRGKKTHLLNVECINQANNQSIELLAQNENQQVTAVAFHPDGDRFFVGESNGTVYSRALTDENSNKPIKNLFTTNRGIKSLVSSPDGRWLAASNGRVIKVHDLHNPDQAAINVCCQKEGGGEVKEAMQFNHSGTRLAAYHRKNRQREILVWELATEKEVPEPLRFRVPYKEHDEPNVWVRTIAFSHDDQWMAAGLGGDNHGILLWPLSSEDLVDLACTRMRGNTQCRK